MNNTVPCSSAADYFPSSGFVTFTAGQGPGSPIQIFRFFIIDDLDVESVETFSVEGDVSAAAFPARFSGNQTSDAVRVIVVDNDGEL